VRDYLLTVAELRARGGGKWRRHPPDVLPAFVADMDFKVAPAVQVALARFVERQDYGYGSTEDLDVLYDAFASWMSRRHGWQPDSKQTVALADVVQGVVATLVAFSAPGDGVIVQTPAYPPFLRTVASSGRRLVENPLLDAGERFGIDFDGLERAASEARLLLFCSPHNPSGRVFTRAELEQVAGIARRSDLVIVSDEIHADLVFPGAEHLPMETIAPERTVTLTSATKSFNIPGARAAVVHFGDASLKERFESALPDFLLGRPSRFGSDATVAAWTQSEDWLAELMAYLETNRQTVSRWVASRTGVGYHQPEATYLAWLDFRSLGLEPDPYTFFIETAHVALSNGADFGGPGIGHVRLNFGTSAEILEEILSRMSHAIDRD